MNYTLDYFINKFEAIPDEQWCVGNYAQYEGPNGVWRVNLYEDDVVAERRCALGHCGYRKLNMTDEGKALASIFQQYGLSVSIINDEKGVYKIHGVSKAFDQETPKARILAALKLFKNIETMEELIRKDQ